MKESAPVLVLEDGSSVVIVDGRIKNGERSRYCLHRRPIAAVVAVTAKGVKTAPWSCALCDYEVALLSRRPSER